MPTLYRSPYTDPASGEERNSEIWWYEFTHKGKWIRACSEASDAGLAFVAMEWHMEQLKDDVEAPGGEMDQDSKKKAYVTQCAACSVRREWPLQTVQRTVQEAISDAKKQGWSRLDGNWLCPGHATLTGLQVRKNW
ncbi:MAG: hypothetical protein ABI693_28190 [Bryobacteraceae bacterium]